MDGRNRLEELVRQMRDDIEKDAAPRVERLTVRQFLAWFGFYRRSRYNLSWMRACLEDNQLLTEPDFEGIWIDDQIQIRLDPQNGDDVVAEQPALDPTIRITAIAAAHRKPHALPPDATLTQALTLMRMDGLDHLLISHETSTERGTSDVRGVLTWRSAALKGAADQNDVRVNHVMDISRPEIRIDDPLFRAMEPIARYGFVLVRGIDQTITGIITANDFALEFDRLARPFLMIGEIEGYLRKLIRGRFTPDELKAVMPESAIDDQVGPGDMTFGGYVRLLEREGNWNRLELKYVDRGEFIKHLDWLRTKRNDIMHFNPDGLEQEEANEIERLTEFFRSLN